MRTFLRVASLVGFLICGFLFVATFPGEQAFVGSATSFLEKRVARELSEKFAAATGRDLSESTRKLQTLMKQRAPEVQKQMEEAVAEIGPLIERLVKLDARQRERLRKALDEAPQRAVTSLFARVANLEQLVERRVLVLIERLLVDLRIFLGVNTALFGILLLLARSKAVFTETLMLPGILLLAATLVAAGFHIFGRDWFHTLLTNDLAGFAYLAYVGVTFGFLLDIGMNKARVTQVLLNAVGGIFGPPG